jgi:hypothetical protein
MVKYRITEDQLQRVFESLEMKKIKEMDNYNYPTGSDTSDAPWNQKEPIKSKPTSAEGVFQFISNSGGEYLFLNKETKQLLYTLDDVWETQTGNKWEDIKDQLSDFLEIPQEDDEDEGGRYMTNTQNWKEYIDSNDVANALESYMNYLQSKGKDLGVVELDAFESGNGQFLIVTPESVNEIHDQALREKARELLGIN